MKYLLDTNVCITYLNGRSWRLKQRLEAQRPENIYVCAIVKGELYYGAWRSRQPQVTLQAQNEFLNLFSSLPFDDQAAKYYAEIRATLASKGLPIGPNDLLIAAIALANNVTLITHNVREFSRIEGLLWEDWES
jgi:tRNA(fMet)-specific endonuclease VapC